jgi:hypothetical protein
VENNNFSNIFGQFFGSKIDNTQNCNTCGYKAYSDNIKYIKNKMVSDIKKARASKYQTKSAYDAELAKSYNEIFKYIRNI